MARSWAAAAPWSWDLTREAISDSTWGRPAPPPCVSLLLNRSRIDGDRAVDRRRRLHASNRRRGAPAADRGGGGRSGRVVAGDRPTGRPGTAVPEVDLDV